MAPAGPSAPASAPGAMAPAAPSAPAAATAPTVATPLPGPSGAFRGSPSPSGPCRRHPPETRDGAGGLLSGGPGGRPTDLTRRLCGGLHREKISDDRRSREGGIWMVPQMAAGRPGPSPWETRTAPPDGPPTAPARLSPVRGRGTQLHIIPWTGARPRPSPPSTKGASAISSGSPTGSASSSPCAWSPAWTTPTEEGAPSGGPHTDVTVIRNAVYKGDGTGYMDDRRLHFWTLDGGSGELHRVTPGDSLWNDRNAHLSPDGLRIAFDRDASGQEYDGSPNRDLFIVEVAGGDPTPCPSRRVVRRLPSGPRRAPAWPTGTPRSPTPGPTSTSRT
jgi:hypothetical protein